MKKAVLLVLSCLFIISLSACNSTVDNKSEIPPPEVVISDTITLKGAFLKEYSDIDSLDINKFLGTSLVKVRPLEHQESDIPIISTTQTHSNLVFNLMHLDPSYVSEYAIFASQNTTRAYSVAILKAAPGYEESIVVGLNSRLNDLSRIVKDYPDQLHLVENVVMEQVGDYLVFLVCDNASKVFEEIHNVMAKTDLSVITSVPYMTPEEIEKLESISLEKALGSLSSEVDDVIVTPVDNPVDNPVDKPVDKPIDSSIQNTPQSDVIIPNLNN